ncbi:40S ribosomal subunit biogenesis protein [Komagataella phaffii CBS 7435]|uniref:RNA-binding protein implicated in ribosome biogenesis n=2 Tax=Komagataella phaffii TaxID=460519 RepID=C4QV99_KOMPG|nr:Putative RNA-binding protein implicated in ribosome biogenesis [Komagataella phaffii GS115]AOA61761.1 GQ67_02368T0 [Komagataella phaffii]CAH2445826.1 40S ribosomal subunit biogenesis protein [Komagataella phaffii CBS 7435]AOA66693.1 GQ68_02879T0 [Komagataella phaffii GS115]CAY67172.1 Putative RNA-binding protein implicated in ribosome biogenesis [Komagataella phaffii GS115]CCA36281.1 40S ribosomal subunit biogenesis protein [Komagataella phaffii CBS 7435]
MGEEKLTKKQKKALEFRKSKEEREISKKEKAEKLEQEAKLKAEKEEEEAKRKADAPKKKRKTRRGKGGKISGPRFILFVGNLSFKCTEEDLKNHFKNCSPDTIRPRLDKGFAFLEFKQDDVNVRKRMDIAISMHHTVLNDRKINVELTAGGGGNSTTRLEKIKGKNDKLLQERKDKIKKKLATDMAKAKEKEEGSKDTVKVVGIHPDRAKLIQQ